MTKMKLGVVFFLIALAVTGAGVFAYQSIFLSRFRAGSDPSVSKDKKEDVTIAPSSPQVSQEPTKSSEASVSAQDDSVSPGSEEDFSQLDSSQEEN